MNDSKKNSFANLPFEERAARGRAGGLATSARGNGHKWTSEEAREAGRKGGLAIAAKKAAIRAQATPPKVES